MISDNKEVLIAFHEKDNEDSDDIKKKYRTAAIWTNYKALVNTLQTLFSKTNRRVNSHFLAKNLAFFGLILFFTSQQLYNEQNNHYQQCTDCYYQSQAYW